MITFRDARLLNKALKNESVEVQSLADDAMVTLARNYPQAARFLLEAYKSNLADKDRDLQRLIDSL